MASLTPGIITALLGSSTSIPHSGQKVYFLQARYSNQDNAFFVKIMSSRVSQVTVLVDVFFGLIPRSHTKALFSCCGSCSSCTPLLFIYIFYINMTICFTLNLFVVFGNSRSGCTGSRMARLSDIRSYMCMELRGNLHV